MQPLISVSELGTFQTCPRKHYYEYNQGLAPRSIAKYFSVGKLFHLIMAEYYRGSEEDIATITQRVVREAENEYDGVLDSIPPMVDAIDRLFDEDRFVFPDEVLSVEEEFLIDLPELVAKWPDDSQPPQLKGYMDAVIRHEGSLYVVEHKTSSQPWQNYRWNFNYQGIFYMRAAELLYGERPNGIIYNFLYTRNKTWRPEIRYWTSSQAHYDEAVDDMLRAVAGISGQIYHRAPGFQCEYCAFATPCVAAMQGEDLLADETYLKETYEQDKDKAARYALMEG